MKIFILKIEGVMIEENKAYTVAQLNGNTPYVKANANPSAEDYNDVSTIENWKKYQAHVNADYVLLKQQVKLLFDAKAGTEDLRWAACTDAEKDIVAACFLVSGTKVLERYPTTKSALWKEHVALCTSARQKRVDAVMPSISEILTVKADRIAMWSKTHDKATKFVGTGDTDLSDWMNNVAPYASAGGFAQKSYFTQAILDKFNNIVNTGLY